ncbi:MAG: SurA N-terminal domain-containing protein [Beijerinckiaceae bacterium]|jgi:peptidyl-prolyl cis-trans isomerase SurA|nr:SurA N-terminal domain-containing protein [Beijerinckiaceae bacterium]
MNTWFRRLLLPLLALGFAGAAAVPASAQNAVATVDGLPITNFDVAQRIRIVQQVEGRRMDRRTAIQELIDDKVKLIQARRSGYRVTEEGVEVEYNRIAKSGGRDIKTFDLALRQAGIEPASLRDKIRADLAWQVLLRDQARKGAQVSPEELEKAIDEEMKKQKPIVDYFLRNVVFVVPRGVSPGAREAAANAARARFSGCETGFDEMRNLPEVAIRQATFRSSDQMNDALLKLLDRTPVGKLTPPFRTEQGIEMVAVCERNPRPVSQALRTEVMDRLSERRVTDRARSYIAELRKTMDIRMLR